MELRHPVQLFSGIAPSAELLQAMGKPSFANGGSAPTVPPRKPAKSGSTPYVPPTPNNGEGTTSQLPPQGGIPQDAPPMYSEAPPSYEDAVADQLPPVDGGETRPQYAPPMSGEDHLLPSDEKRGWH